MVFYRKYRPQKIEELDSKNVRDKLYAVLESPSHAFLFTGPKGLGKTSAARIVAKALNCEKKNQESGIMNKGRKKNKEKIHDSQFIIHDSKSVEPCNKCSQCTSITKGTNLDVLEIDGASNRGIDEIRDLREKVKLSPLSSRKKAYIIDEVHMLTAEAFNALLKTLEEPPSHVVFILCTTEPHKVPETIISRCLHVQFRKATKEELIRSFERIIKGEKLKADIEALNLIAGLSDGSFRDGAKILEEMTIARKDKKITKDLVESTYKVSNIRHYISDLIEALEKKDTKKGLEIVAQLSKQGIDFKYFMEELINNLHTLMLEKAGVSQESRAYNLNLEISDIKRLVELLSKAYGELKYAVLPQIPLELVIVEWGINKEGGSVAPSSRPTSSLASSLRSLDGTPSSRATPLRLNSAPIIPSTSRVAQQNIANYSENDALFQALIDKVKSYNHSIAGVLRGCRVKSYDSGDGLIIETNFKFHKEKLSERKTKDLLEKVCREITKKNVKITVVLKPAFAKASAGDGR
ncbi:MAG: DNA polymerase III subunit gamma/tau [Candidatus Levybacteria bacterium]|nr:DNA polymerase III subunit gamma/tau [Candidatus Levybacteria bacterium]